MRPKNILAVAAKLRGLRHEEHYNQGEWAQKTSCGTAACIAGHAVQIAGYRLLFLRRNYSPDWVFGGCVPKGTRVTKWTTPYVVSPVAQKFLGLTGEQANVVFSSYPEDSWPGEFGERWGAVASGLSKERPSRIASDFLEALAKRRVKLWRW